MSKIETKLDAYIRAREVHDAAYRASADAKLAKAAAEYELVDAMVDEKTRSLKRDDGCLFYLKNKTSCSVTQENAHQIREWLIEEEGDDREFLVEVINKEQLLEWLAAKVDGGELQQDELPEFLSYSTRPGMNVNGWKARKKKEE